MSHIEDIDLVILDLDALRASVGELGAEWREGQQTYEWFGQVMGDYPLPKGFTAEDLGKCAHAIRLPGCKYEIGVVKKKDGPGYTLLYDFWGDAGRGYGRGEMLKAHFGPKLGRLTQLYGVNKATLAARAKGYTVQRKRVGTDIKLVIGGV